GPARDECRLHPCNGIDLETVAPQERRERVDRLKLVPADLGVMTDPVGDALELAIPGCRHTREHAIARGVVARGQALRVLGWLEPGLERIDLPQDTGGSFALDVGGLGDEGQGEKERRHCTIPKRCVWVTA